MRYLVTMPRYSQQAHMEAAAAFMQPTRAGSPLEFHPFSPGGSLLANVMNICWGAACDLFEAGELDGFAMIHSDVAPVEPARLDPLHEALVGNDLDVLSAVVPIKDERGLSSTAVDDTGNVWRPRRLAMKELKALPEVFTSADVGAPLLVNTGLMAVKLGPWCERVCFTIRDRIEKGADGVRRALAQSEDWDFSRQCHRLGLKVGATRAVKVRHHGDYGWSNQGGWGWETDRMNRRPEVAPA